MKKLISAAVTFLGRKGCAFVLTLGALVTTGLADKAAAEAIGWAIVGAFGVFAGANSAVTIGTSQKVPAAAPKEDEAA